MEHESVQPHTFRHGCIEVQQHPVGRERVANRVVERSLAGKFMDVVQRHARNHRVGGRERFQEATLAKSDPVIFGSLCHREAAPRTTAPTSANAMPESCTRVGRWLSSSLPRPIVVRG
jgi:hypothetical protein